MCEEMSTDNELLYMIRQQDDWAVENLLNKYKPMICGMIFKLSQLDSCSVSSEAYKEDLEQESRMMLIGAAENYREDYPCSFKTYLQNCLRKRLLTIYRHSQCSSDAAFYAIRWIRWSARTGECIRRTRWPPTTGSLTLSIASP